MEKAAIVGAVTGMAVGGALGVTAIAVVAGDGVAVVFGFGGGLPLVGALLVLLVSLRD